MKKEALTKELITRELLCQLDKRKSVAIYLTAFSCVSILCYAVYTILYADQTFTSISTAAAIFVSTKRLSS